MRLLFYGGTFNPPHLGHAAAAKTAWDCLAPDKLIWMPAGDPPHKPLPPGTPHAAHRLEMSRLALMGFDGARVSDLEIRLGLRYTLDTADALSAELPGAEITILVGADMLMSLNRWNRASELMARYPVAALPRTGGALDELERKSMELRRAFGARITILPHAPVEISSTAVRELIKNGGGREYLAGPVYEYIMRHGLYTC